MSVGVKAAIGDLVRYDAGPTALMRVTDIIGGRYYGRAFHSSGTCTSRAAVTEPTEADEEKWQQCHDDGDQWIKGAWG